MSFATVKTYFQDRCESLGFTEHKDAFNFENISSTKLDHAYHLTVGQARGTRKLNGILESDVEITVRLFFKGYKNPSEGVDLAIVESEELLSAALHQGGIAEYEGLIGVRFGSMDVGPFHESNDNSIISTLNFTALVATTVEGA